MVANYLNINKPIGGATATPAPAPATNELRDAKLPPSGPISTTARHESVQLSPEVGLSGRLNRLAMSTVPNYETAAVQMLLKHCMNTETHPTGRMTPKDLSEGLKFIQKQPGGELTIEKGAQGELIRDVQQRLQRLGLLDAAPTGTWASKTESALVSFRMRIPALASQPEGVLTIDTLAYLLKETSWRPQSFSAKQAAPVAKQEVTPGRISQYFDHKDLAAMEGQFRTKGYTLPAKQYPTSGVTISNGVDLGQWSKKELLEIGVSRALVEKLGPYMKDNLQGAAAEKYLKAHPLTITPAESKHLYERVFGQILGKFAEHYEKNRTPNAPHFSELPDKLKTAFGSMAFNMGPNFTEVSGKDGYSKWRRTIGDQIFAGNFEKAFQLLVANPHSQEGLSNRRFKEAAIVLEYLAAKDPEAAGRLLANTELACSKAGKLKAFTAFKHIAGEFKPGLLAGIPVPEGHKEKLVAETQKTKDSAKKDGATHRERPQVHIVKTGDTLSEIAQRYDCTVEQLKQANRLKGDVISVGQKIRLPGDQVAKHEQGSPKPRQRSISEMRVLGSEPPRMLEA